jgi:hypothetical protein
MKIVIAVLAFVLCAGTASAQGIYGNNASNSGAYGTGSNPNNHYVQPHTNSNGTYVQGHQQTNPNSTQRDNYGTRGNVNPYTGAVGTKTPQW